jgi:hypothetical protein
MYHAPTNITVCSFTMQIPVFDAIALWLPFIVV